MKSQRKEQTKFSPMRIKVLERGRVVLPVSVRRKLGMRVGDLLEVGVRGGRITLTPRRMRSRKARILVDPITGLPVLSAGLMRRC